MAYTTIKKPSDYFNTKLYTGNGTTDTAQTGVGFQPDWTIIKARSIGYNHNVFDAVRGSTKRIMTDVTNAESTQAEMVKSFDSDGFTLGNDAGVNANTETFVSWNWLAAGTAPSKTYAVTVVSDSGNKYRFDGYGTSAVTLEISEGGTYRFDQSDSSNSGHPLRFSTTSDGTHGGGSEYTTGVTTNGTPGSAGAYTEITVAASAPTLYYYCSVHSGMGGQANTPTTNSFSNFNGSIQSNISPNTTSGFSIVKYNGTNSNSTIGHGLGAVPKMMLIKNISSSYEWCVYHEALAANQNLQLNTTAAAAESDVGDVWNSTAPTTTTFGVGGNKIYTNYQSEEYIAYCFAEVPGYSKFGTVNGNGNNDGPFVYTGFSPSLVLYKKYNGVGDWYYVDNKRPGYNDNDKRLYANTSQAEETYDLINLYSNGFKLTNATHTYTNDSSGTYLYMAFAEEPLVGDNPATAR